MVRAVLRVVAAADIAPVPRQGLRIGEGRVEQQQQDEAGSSGEVVAGHGHGGL